MSSRFGASIINENGVEMFNCNTTPFVFFKKISIRNYSWNKEFSGEYVFDLGIPFNEGGILVFKYQYKNIWTCHPFIEKIGSNAVIKVRSHNYGDLLTQDSKKYSYEIKSIKDMYCPTSNDFDFYVFVSSSKYLPQQKYGTEFYNSNGEKLYCSNDQFLKCISIPTNASTNKNWTYMQSDFQQIPNKPTPVAALVGNTFNDYTEDYIGENRCWVNYIPTPYLGLHIRLGDIMYFIGGEKSREYGTYIGVDDLLMIDAAQYD